MLREIIELIDAFDAECQEEYTDTGDAWDLLNTVRERARGALAVQGRLVAALKRLLGWVGVRSDRAASAEYWDDVRFAREVLRGVESAAGGVGDALARTLAEKAADALGVASCVHRASGEYDRTVSAVADVLRGG